MAGAMAQMQEQMKNMPPEQRAQHRSDDEGRGAAWPAPALAGEPHRIQKVGTDKVGKWTCDKYEGRASAEKMSEVCTVAPDVARRYTAGDFESHPADWPSSSRSWRRRAPSRCSASASTPANGFAGVPVRMITFDATARRAGLGVADVSRQNFPDATFAVPAGYQKRRRDRRRTRPSIVGIRVSSLGPFSRMSTTPSSSAAATTG